MKKNVLLLIFVLTFCFSGIFSIFYFEDLRIKTPTPKPAFIKRKVLGDTVKFDLNGQLTLVHFFNPNCPCSKFNSKHVEEIMRDFKDNLRIIAYTTQKTDKQYPFPVFDDSKGEVAKKFGVYSTPQAVLLDANGKVLYSGNYNSNRYCSDENSAFVKQAIISSLQNDFTIIKQINNKSGLPYGCSIF
ncbi:MAG: redoxin domain-containing protein [Cytophagales bacterium]